MKYIVIPALTKIVNTENAPYTPILRRHSLIPTTDITTYNYV